MSLTYATPEGMTTALRSASSAPFQVLSTFVDGRPVQRCSTSADMAGRLDTLATLTARRSLSPEQRESEFPVLLGVIDIRDFVIGEPPSPMLVFANKDKTEIAVVIDGHAAEVTLKTETLEWVKTICS
jgi:hypothetical protein